MVARTRRLATRSPRLTPRAQSSFEVVAIVGFKDSQTGVDEFALGNHDDVVAGSDLVAPKNLSYQSLSSIPGHRATQLTCGRNAQTSHPELVRSHKQRGVASMNPSALLVDPLKLHAPPNPLGRTEWRHLLFAADR